MRISKKVLITGTLCVVVLAGTLGGFAIASADDETTPPITTTIKTDLMDKVAEIYEKNTGTAIDSAELQKAFEEAGAAIRTDARDAFLQKLVDEGKITQDQADQWKAWLDARPDTIMSDQFKTWLESRPEIPELFGNGGLRGIMPFGGMMDPDDTPFGGMHRNLFGGNAGQGIRGCLPGINN